MTKKMLVVINPNSGVKRANKYLTDIISTFNEAGFECNVQATTRENNATKCVVNGANDKDVIVCIGGDGTFNEALNGLRKIEKDIPIGYIPSGSTNDFAASLGISKNIMKAARDIVAGKAYRIDAGEFNGKSFSYVASCGAFTDTSYSTPTDMKNALGHTAYLIEGLKSIPNIKPLKLKIEVDNRTLNGEYIMAAVCNATSIGGILKFDKNLIDFSDGLFELLLIKAPRDAAELTKILHFINTKSYNNDCIQLISTSFAKIQSELPIDWSLDGEKECNVEKCEIYNIPKAFRLIINKS